MEYFLKKIRDGGMVSSGPADPPPLLKVFRSGPDPASPKQAMMDPEQEAGLWASQTCCGGPAPATDGASTAAVRDLVDGGVGASQIPASQRSRLIN